MRWQPSFNGALASDPAASMPEAGGGQRQFLCVMNTILALLGASVAAFASSSAFSGKFNMVHIQNATLAGGVAIGSAANLSFTPAGAVGVGILAGVLSTAGFRSAALDMCSADLHASCPGKAEPIRHHHCCLTVTVVQLDWTS